MTRYPPPSWYRTVLPRERHKWPCVSSILHAMERILAHNLEERCSANTTPKHIPLDLEIFFSAGPEPISLSKYVERLVEYTQCSESVFVVALVYLHRAQAVRRELALTYTNSYRLFCAALYVASKHTDDIVYDGEHYAAVFGIELDELLKLEARLLRVLQWNLFVTDATYIKFDKQLKNTLGTIRIVKDSDMALTDAKGGEIYLGRYFTRGMALQALITMGLMIFSAPLPSKETRSVKYFRLNFPSIHLPRVDMGIEIQHVTLFADNGVRFPGTIGFIGSSGVQKLITSAKADQTIGKGSNELNPAILASGNTVKLRISHDYGTFTVLFDAMPPNSRRTDTEIARPSSAEDELTESRHGFHLGTGNERSGFLRGSPDNLDCLFLVSGGNRVLEIPSLSYQAVFDSLDAHSGAKANSLRAIINSHETKRSHITMMSGSDSNRFRIKRVRPKMVERAKHSKVPSGENRAH